MTAPESALDVAREVAPGLEWKGDQWHATVYVVGVELTFSMRDGCYAAAYINDDYCISESLGPDPRACLRAVLDEVHQWALDVARATVPAGYQLVTACVPPEIPGEDPDPIY